MKSKSDLIIYEGAMCCATGICGPEPDKNLIEFNESLKRLSNEYGDNLNIFRASIIFNSLVFQSNKDVIKLIKEQGQDVLPITTINGKILAKQKYMTYSEMKDSLDKEIADV